MIRLAISVEGQTEEEFIKSVLAPHLQSCGVAAQAILLGRARNLGATGGHVTIKRLVSEMAYLAHSFDAVSSLVDFYGFKGKKEKSVKELEDLIRRKVEEKIGWQRNSVAPYVQMYEFEGLLFSDVGAFSSALPETSPQTIRALDKIRSNFSTPEDINDSASTAPSHRVANTVPHYRKRVHGPLIAAQIGVEKIRANARGSTLGSNTWKHCEVADELDNETTRLKILVEEYPEKFADIFIKMLSFLHLHIRKKILKA